MKYSVKIIVALIAFLLGTSIFLFWNCYFENLPEIVVANELSVDSDIPIKVDFCDISDYSDKYEGKLIVIDGVLATGDGIRIGMLYPIGCGFPKNPTDIYKNAYPNLIHIDLQNYEVLLETLTEKTKNGGFSCNEVNVRVVGKITSKIIGSATKLYTIVPIKIEKTSPMRDSTAYGGA